MCNERTTESWPPAWTVPVNCNPLGSQKQGKVRRMQSATGKLFQGYSTNFILFETDSEEIWMWSGCIS